MLVIMLVFKIKFNTMKKLDIFRCMAISVLALGITHLTQGQSRIVSVSPGVATLNNAIDGDTTATGDRIDPENTVYQLEGGQLYELDDDLNNEGFPLYIRTNPADSERAQLRPFDDGGGASRAFNAEGDLRLEGVKVSNVDQNGVLQERLIRLRDNGIKLTVDNCWLEIDDQAGIRCDDPDTKIFISNSIISNIGQGDDPDNGRLIDDRGEDIDSLVIYNTVIYNITSRFLRDGGGIINYAKVDQNTLVNSAQRGFDFGIAKEVYFTNNMVINGSFEGIDVPANPGEESEAFVSVDEYLPDPAAQILVISHNNTFTQSELTDVYPSGIGPVPLTNDEVEAFVTSPGLLSTNTSEVVELNDGPEPPVSYLNEFFNGDVANSPEFWDPTFATYDFTYSPLLDSYTGGDQGQPIGILFEADVPCESPYPQVDGLSFSNENGGVLLTWNPIPGSIGCQVQAGTSFADAQTITVAGEDASSFFIPGSFLNIGQTYSYRVRCGCSTNPLIVGPYSAISQFTFLGAGLAQQSEPTLRAVPNPNNGVTFISLVTDIDEEQGLVEVYDMSGRLVETVYSGSITADHEMRFQFNRTDLPDGVYIMRYSTSTTTVNEKMIISR